MLKCVVAEHHCIHDGWGWNLVQSKITREGETQGGMECKVAHVGCGDQDHQEDHGDL